MIKRTPQEIADFFGCYVYEDSRYGQYEFRLSEERPKISNNEFWDCCYTDAYLFHDLIELPPDHDWTHLYEPRITHEKRMENARITQEPRTNPASLCSHQSEVHTHKEYKVVCYTYENSLNEAITSMMAEGWKPQGSIAMVYLGEIYSPPIMFAQAMVRGL